VERTVYIITVVYVYKSGVVLINTQVVIENPHATYSPYPAVTVPDVYVTDLGNPSVEVIINRYVFDLDNSTIVIVLYKWVVIETGIKGYAGRTYSYTVRNINTVVYEKIELPIRVYRKCNPIMNKNKGVIISISVTVRNSIIRCGSHGTRCTKKKGCNQKY
jgi:hypothetical protein